MGALREKDVVVTGGDVRGVALVGEAAARLGRSTGLGTSSKLEASSSLLSSLSANLLAMSAMAFLLSFISAGGARCAATGSGAGLGLADSGSFLTGGGLVTAALLALRCASAGSSLASPPSYLPWGETLGGNAVLPSNHSLHDMAALFPNVGG